ncbi:MAG: hypothetical protein KF763_05935 [Cyclobacteriaceae bacterium]|nr:hypothetical protein [Cyclobacteriaceae bacterium]
MRKSLIFFAVLLTAVSCYDENSIDQRPSLIDLFLVSDSFKNLDIQKSELELESASINDQEGQKIIVIPYFQKTKYVFSRTINGNQFFRTYAFEYISEMNYESLTQSLERKDYTGGIEITFNKNDILSFQVDKDSFKAFDAKQIQGSKTAVRVVEQFYQIGGSIMLIVVPMIEWEL